MSSGISPKLRATNGQAVARNVVLQVANLVKVYGDRTVVNGVSFKVHEGEVVGLLGANGAGKSTTFRMTCGLIPSNSGRIVLNGRDVTRWSMHRRVHEGGLGYLPQDRCTFGSLTTEQNLYAAMEFLGYSRRERHDECERLLKRFNLLKVRKTLVGMGGDGGLSGGERRRLEVARALLTRPKILLLDEPFANVDPITVTEFQEVIRDLSKSGIAILITDHQVVETLAITERSYIIHDGKVLCSGTEEEVLGNPEARRAYFGEKASKVPTRASANQDEKKRDASKDREEDEEEIARPRERRSLAYRRRQESEYQEDYDARSEEARDPRDRLKLRRRREAPEREQEWERDATEERRAKGRSKLDFRRRRKEDDD